MTRNYGFSLVEMSLVLVMMAIILGGILVGKSLITAAELRAVTTEQAIYATAFKEFVDKYQAIPGDMSTAETIWGSDSSCPTTASNTIPKVVTCNGDGTGTIGNWTNTATSGGTEYEWFRAWQQLSNAELIEGKFTGVSNSASSTTTNPGVNVPRSKNGKAAWTLLWMNSTNDNNFFFSATLAESLASHTLLYGGQTASSFTDSAVLRAMEAKNIDTKIDDGLPFTGNVRAKAASAGTCSASGATTSDYKSTTSSTQDMLVCQLMFIVGM